MPFDEQPGGIDRFDWGSQDFINYIGNTREFKDNQFFRGLDLLISRSPWFTDETDLWSRAFRNASPENLDRARNDFFKDLRTLLESAKLDKIVQVYQLRGFQSSIAMRPLLNGESFLPEERKVLIETMHDRSAQRIARKAYPVTASGQILRSNFERTNFTIVNSLLQKPGELLPYDFLLKKELINKNTNIGNLKDAINHKFSDLSLPTRVGRTDIGLEIRLEG